MNQAALRSSGGGRAGSLTGWIALHHLARLQTSDDVVVLGASGGLGGTASRLAAIHPARRVIGVAGSDAKRRFMPTECTDVICGSQLSTALTEITDGRGVDVVIDPVGGQLRAEAYERLAPFGRLIVLGNASGQDQALSSDAAWHGTRHLAGLSLGGSPTSCPPRSALRPRPSSGGCTAASCTSQPLPSSRSTG